MENVGAGDLSMPEQEMHTTAFWLHFPGSVSGALCGFDADGRAERPGGHRSVIAHRRSALSVMCDPRDLGVSITEDIAGVAEGLRAESCIFTTTTQEASAKAHHSSASRRGFWRGRLEAGAGVPVRIRLPKLRGSDRRSGRAGKGSRGADFAENYWHEIFYKSQLRRGRLD